jgi:hypothetical protein
MHPIRFSHLSSSENVEQISAMQFIAFALPLPIFIQLLVRRKANEQLLSFSSQFPIFIFLC